MIKYVAVYLRKSRDEKDSADVLSKHRDTLVTICNNNNWKYKLYEEIASGERIAYRPVMQELLEDVEQGTYDAVLVMDIDRLGRGNNKDWGIIYESFCNHKNNTLIVTPQRTYDLTVDTDEMMVDFQSLFAKLEYKAIKKRMLRGKTAGAKQGLWVCGKPPLPYVVKNKKLEVDQDKYKIYRLIVEKCLMGDSIEEITVYLNINKIPSPNNTNWSSRTVTRLLTNEVHLGYMIYGKTKGDTRRKNFCKVSKNDWIKVSNCHPAVKTQEEHNKILQQIESRRTIPVAARKRTHVLSGLLYCGQCGYRMVFKKSSSGYYIAMCEHKYPDGSKCTQRGIKLSDEFFDRVYKEVFELDENKFIEIHKKHQNKIEILTLIKNNQQELEKIKQAIERIYDLYECGSIDKNMFTERISKREQQKYDLEQKIKELEIEVNNISSSIDFLNIINIAKTNWIQGITNEQKNKALSMIVKKIVYQRISIKEYELLIFYK